MFSLTFQSDYSLFVVFFFFKQKTAYEMRISDWSSDVCSSDLFLRLLGAAIDRPLAALDYADRLDALAAARVGLWDVIRIPAAHQSLKIGRASCRERVCQYV